MSVTISAAGPDPLPPAVTKLLVDKLYEKRKTAALDVEKIIRDLMAAGNQLEISKIVKYLSINYVLSQNQNNKKGGLIGLAACTIALGKEAQKYRSDLVPSVLSCFSDPDSRVRYYACESLYNIVKVLRSNVLIYFNEIFDGLCKLCCDLDLNVRNGAELLDRLLKDTVTENSGSEKFDIIVLMQLLRERIYAKNSFVRQFLVSWLKVLDSEPNLYMVNHISDLLDGLFQILDDNNAEIKRMCENLLNDFLKEITAPHVDKLKHESMINIILIHCANTNDDSIQLTAMSWLKELTNLLTERALYFIPGILNVILPCLSYSDEGLKKNIKELAFQINSTLWKLIETKSRSLEVKEEENNLNNKLPIDKFIESLSRLAVTPSDPASVITTIESLKWILHLVNNWPTVMLDHVDDFFPLLIQFLSDRSKEAVELDLRILATISVSSYLIEKKSQDEHNLKTLFPKYNYYFNKFMSELLELFKKDPNLRYEKGSIIIKELCTLLNPEDIYRMLSEILVNEKDSEFSTSMVDILNSILLTASELFDLRDSLREFNTKESHSLFVCLYKTWSHNPIATIALCLLSQNYEHAYNLVKLFGNIEITMNLLITIDKLVQLIESSVFTYLRLHLLDVERNQYLVRALYGLLMILPQSDAFMLLKRRLDCVPNFFNKISNDALPQTKNDDEQAKKENKYEIDFEMLLNHFVQVQEKHRFFKNSKRITN